MNIGTTVPLMEPGWDRALFKQWVEEIDQGQWSSLSIGERINFVNPEFMTSLSACAAWSERVELISTISVVTMHNPVLLAKQFATIDLISNGRLTVGVGVGGREEDYAAIGADWNKRRLAILEQHCATMRKVWAGEKVVESALRRVEPLPVQSGGPTILSGAIGPKSIKAAARFADGLSGFSLTASLEEIKNSFDQMTAAWQQQGRTGKPRLIASFWYGLEAEGKQKMLQHLTRYMNFMPQDIVDMLLPIAGFNGSVAELKDFINEVKSLGADDVILVPTCTDIDELRLLNETLF
ncbi:LLM class flavin-dependent oxidoreductase [Oceanicoccus sp. KOV_DT_Chl]|uniref:LLM class flavin-dependent oxidoreductase n=1 Tax=Oceanicoccus sp. KOV_DT_Chl TaxID=1904639 RepID=UPI000C7AAC95|nr:LLM class flavin-dependent oxidoreductase [Oceanicoccus sp. KOV_DT_Chl]